MGYRIVYGKTPEKTTFNDRKQQTGKRIAVWTAALIAAVSICWIGWSHPDIRQYILPGDPQVTGAALDQLIDDIRSGDPVSDAVAAFCKEIIDSAPLE